MNAEVTVRHDLPLEEMCRAAQLDPRLVVPILNKYQPRRRLRAITIVTLHLVRTIPARPGRMEHLLAAANSLPVTNQTNALVVAAGTVRDEGGKKFCPAFHVRDGEIKAVEVPLGQPNKHHANAQVLYLAID